MRLCLSRYSIHLFQNLMKNIALLFCILGLLCAVQGQPALVLKGGTILDVTAYGNSEKDITNAIVVIQGKTIVAAGSASSVKIPKGAKVVDVSGKYIVPGLIDGFGIVNNQAYANAYLYMGVTTAVITEDDRRGTNHWSASPAPGMIKLDALWGAKTRRREGGAAGFEVIESWSKEKIDHYVDSLAKDGVKVLLVHYAVSPSQLPVVVAACRRNGIVTLGELGLSRYKQAVDAGIQSFVHTSRYTADILPDSVRTQYATAPFGSPARYYYTYITKNRALLRQDKFKALAKLYHDHAVGLVPTAGMLMYPEMPFATNPWREPAAAIIDEEDIEFEPLDKATGKPKNPAPNRQQSVSYLAALDSALVKAGAHYLTGTGTDAFGTLPGISLHNELAMLSHFGLTNRQVLACATHNFALLWHWTHLGKIEAGREADILVLDKNPVGSLANLKAINTLVVDGVMIGREGLLKK
jgi:hypothetical protein